MVWWDSKGLSDLENVYKGDVSLPALDPTHIGPIQPRHERKLLLGEMLPLSQVPNPVSESAEQSIRHDPKSWVQLDLRPRA